MFSVLLRNTSFPWWNITTLSMVSKAGLRTPDCGHFYFGNVRRSEYCYMKKIPKVVNSEDFREGSTCFASVKACSFPELPLTYTWGRKKQDSLRRNCLGSHIWSVRTQETHATPALTPHPTKQHRSNPAPSSYLLLLSRLKVRACIFIQCLEITVK